MSEAPEPESRDQEPSEKKVTDAVERGETPVVHDLRLLGSVVGAYVALRLIGQTRLHEQIGMLGAMLDRSWDIRLGTGSDAIRLLYDICLTVCAPLSALILSSLAISVAIGSASRRPRVILKRLKVDFSRLDLVKGLTRIFGREALVSFGKTLAKNLVAFIGVWVVARDIWRQIAYGVDRQPAAVAEFIVGALQRIVLAIALVVACFALLELVTSRIAWRRRLRMTRQEVKDELKQSEGDPLVKMRMRSIALDRARKRMLNEVSSATMVIANPTHFAVALRYLREEGGAPMVVAKGQELIALKISSRSRATRDTGRRAARAGASDIQERRSWPVYSPRVLQGGCGDRELSLHTPNEPRALNGASLEQACLTISGAGPWGDCRGRPGDRRTRSAACSMADGAAKCDRQQHRQCVDARLSRDRRQAVQRFR
ncbi:MAG: EscU/YscU/HrcU family type III secretion system export apparatus switch protein [Rhodoblastus sp.]